MIGGAGRVCDLLLHNDNCADDLERAVPAIGGILSKIGLIAFAMTLMLAGASYAADKITLICSDGEGKDDYSLSIDLDRKLASFHMSDLPDADGIPVTRVTENYIWFQNKALSGIYSQGKLDRMTGSLHFFHRHLNNAKDYYLRCKPAKPL